MWHLPDGTNLPVAINRPIWDIICLTKQQDAPNSTHSLEERIEHIFEWGEPDLFSDYTGSPQNLRSLGLSLTLLN